MAFPKAHGKATKSDPLRTAIALHLRDHGPTPGDDLAAAVSISPERFWNVINHHWFKISGKGWVLTDHGREEVSL